MMGWRARLGFLIPPGNPTIEPEMTEMAPPGVSVHFSRMVAPGTGGTHHGQEERNRSQIEHIDESAELLVKVKPHVMMLAHTATSYTLGRRSEAELLQRLQTQYQTPVATAFGSVVAALNMLGAKRVALGTPYSDEMTLKGKALLEEYGDVISYGSLENVTNIFDETLSAPISWVARWTDQKCRQFFSAGSACLPSRSLRCSNKTLESQRSPPPQP